jgi:hypothetical protein
MLYREVKKRGSQCLILFPDFLKNVSKLHKNVEMANLHHYQIQFFTLQSLNNAVYLIFRYSGAEVG